jgi:predicted nucleotidyltransferase
MRRAEINEYDLGLPMPLAPLAERRRGVPQELWARLERTKARLAALLGPRLREVRLFGSYARGEPTGESDVDVLVLVERLEEGDRDRIVEAVFDAGGALFAPLVLTVEQLDRLRARELLIAQDLDLQGITV